MTLATSLIRTPDRPIPGQEPLVRNALVPITPIDAKRAASSADTRPNADFIAHLIATSTQAPQTRARRRAEPELATAAYRSVGQWPTTPGRRLTRSL
ncbi:MAG: hypothetical protein ABSE22_11570 [Xanthobacteraceae bacterium]|jgi:hypothetical protein